MNSSEYLSMQGRTIAAALAKHGYTVSPAEKDLGWQVSHANEDWWLLLTFLPRPVAQWRFLPSSHNEQQRKLYSIVEMAIGGRR